MTIRSVFSAVAGAAAITTISTSAMAQTTIPISEPGSLGIAALGVGVAIYLARRHRKK